MDPDAQRFIEALVVAISVVGSAIMLAFLVFA
jgi:hypothetical protein